jgi:thioredoxin-related protein
VKNHRLILLAAAACTLLTAPLTYAELGWLNDYKKAQEEAKAKNKFVLLDFTGSDWCYWCKVFDKEIFSQQQFKDYASENLVLMEIDFPWPGSPRAQGQPPELKKQNEELAQQYQVSGFPTIIVLNADGQKVWQFEGFFSAGTAAFIAELEKLRKG